MNKTKIAILGAGNMATALAFHLAKQNNTVHLYCIEPDVEQQINKGHCNNKYMPGTKLPSSILASHEIDKCLDQANYVIIAIPSHVAVSVLKLALPHLNKKTIVINISKGFDEKTLNPVVISLQRALPKTMQKQICMIGGPAIATEMVKDSPIALVIACEYKETREKVVKLFRGRNVKTAQSKDLLGVGLAASLKNAYAIALGFCDGLKYSTNAKAFIVTMAVSEMAGIMLKDKADPKTASSLAGIGDLLVTGWSPHGRNRRYGEKLINSKTNDVKKLGLTTVEGIRASEIGLRLSKKLNAKTPLLDAINKGIHSKNNFHKPFVNYIKTVKLELI
ncbi:NAD(P)H-dependent glycerol-3-phosphate dehydrogenase [Patescibacteria group bacterium]|nr:NAD(P)H-dependent glycerol-3-phosphate dehydrogenase [Patescibacteria group bacterium]